MLPLKKIKRCYLRVLVIQTWPIIDFGIAKVIAALRTVTFYTKFGHQKFVSEGDDFQVVQPLGKEYRNLSMIIWLRKLEGS
jgi:hypothetical protein